MPSNTTSATTSRLVYSHSFHASSIIQLELNSKGFPTLAHKFKTKQ